MAKQPAKKTSRKVAKKAAKLLANAKTPDAVKSVAVSDLPQAPGQSRPAKKNKPAKKKK